MKQEILDIFYNEVVPEAEFGVIQIDGWKFHISFFLKINNQPITSISEKNDDRLEFIAENKEIVITVGNLKLFEDLLIEYTIEMYSFIVSNPNFYEIDNLYFEGDQKNIVKGILATLWINGTEENFKNPEQYIKTRIDFLKDKKTIQFLNKNIIGDHVKSLDDSFIQVNLQKQNPFAHETPFVFTSQIQKNIDGHIEIFKLPNVSYGISDGKCYIYSIQKSSGTNSKLTSYQKKVNRLLYQANKDVNDEYEYENIKDISQPHLFALTLFFKFLDVEDIIVVDYLPIRYNAKIRTLNNQIQKLIHNLDSQKLEVAKQSLEKIDALQNNITQKYIRIFRRLSYHFPNFKIISYPYEIDNYMHMCIQEEPFQSQDHILYDVYHSIDFKKEMDKKRSI